MPLRAVRHLNNVILNYYGNLYDAAIVVLIKSLQIGCVITSFGVFFYVGGFGFVWRFFQNIDYTSIFFRRVHIEPQSVIIRPMMPVIKNSTGDMIKRIIQIILRYFIKK